MAKVDVRMPEDFLLKVSKLAEQTDVIIPKVLEVGGEVVLAKVRLGFQNPEAMVVAMQKLLISLNMVNMGSLQGHF